MSYTEVTVSGYNASPPPDDGTAVAANEITWAGIKTKITDPLKTAIDSTQTNITSWYTSDLSVNLYAPATTAALFYQAAAPTLWTKSTTNNDKAIRVVSGLTGGTAGGTTAFSTVMAARTIAQANLPSVDLSHSLTGTSTANFVSDQNHTHACSDGSNTVIDGVARGAVSSTISGTIALGGSGTAMDFAIQYCDMIIATKD